MPNDPLIDLDYLLYKLREEILKTGANYQTKLYFNKIRGYNIQIPIPVKPNGNFDLEKQKEIANKYKSVQVIKQSLISELEKIQNMELDLA